MFNNVFPKPCRLLDNVEKHGRADRPQTTIRRMRFVCR